MFDARQKYFYRCLFFIAAAAVFSGCAHMDVGSRSAKTAATGAASGAHNENANSQLERCGESLGTLAVIEDVNTDWYRAYYRNYRLGPTTPVLRMLVQQSNCFVVVERSRAMDNMAQERALGAAGELRQESNFGKGQMVSADYSMTPSITFSNKNAGGIGGALHLVPLVGSLASTVAGSMNSKEAGTMLSLVDNRSGVQISIAEGSARNMDFGAIGGLFGGSGGASLGGYTNTAEGKVIVAAFTDAYNNLVRATRNYQQQVVKGGLGTGGGLNVQSN
ncbi:MAG: CsgG/HfaB family protein [Syntrophorhabdaceae bacterium]|nr:CsgG/HfaB family protein [Syntrophorhabdaceae bacterium]